MDCFPPDRQKKTIRLRPLGSILLGPVLFKFYGNDLSDYLGSVKLHQYADDRAIYLHEKPTNLKDGQNRLR